MKIAILGNGEVGIALAKGFLSRGHEVVFGGRDPQGAAARQALEATRQWAGRVRAATYREAARAADLAVLATPWSGTANALALVGADALAGKIVIDVTNPLDFVDGKPRLALGHTDSAGETVQRALPGSRVVKAFNIITSARMVDPVYADGEPDMFIAGNDEAAKAEVAGIVRSFGWRSAIDMGGIEAARLLEPLAMVWIEYGVRHGHWTHGFSLLGGKR